MLSATLRLRQKVAENHSSNSEITKSSGNELIIEEPIKLSEELTTDLSERCRGIENVALDEIPSIPSSDDKTHGSEPVSIGCANGDKPSSNHDDFIKLSESTGTKVLDSTAPSNKPSEFMVTKSLTPEDSFHYSSSELIDVKAKNIFNICLNASDGNNRNKPMHDKPNILIEVLSDCDSTEFIADKNERNEIVVDTETLKPIEIISSPEMEQMRNETEHDKKECVNSNLLIETQSGPASKSTAITFYCESLDDLKGTDSDSDAIFEEI